MKRIHDILHRVFQRHRLVLWYGTPIAGLAAKEDE